MNCETINCASVCLCAVIIQFSYGWDLITVMGFESGLRDRESYTQRQREGEGGGQRVIKHLIWWMMNESAKGFKTYTRYIHTYIYHICMCTHCVCVCCKSQHVHFPRRLLIYRVCCKLPQFIGLAEKKIYKNNLASICHHFPPDICWNFQAKLRFVLLSMSN